MRVNHEESHFDWKSIFYLCVFKKGIQFDSKRGLESGRDRSPSVVLLKEKDG